MRNYIVKDLMVPLSEYATVHNGATLYEAVLALEKAQEEFDHTKYRHRAVLVMDSDKNVVGKLSHIDVIRALEPESEDADELNNLEQFGFTKKLIWNLRKQRRLEVSPIADPGALAGTLKVENCMQALTEGEYVDEETSLDIAAHQLVLGNHLSLLVTRKKNIVGVLRLTDVFAALFHSIKQQVSEDTVA